MTVNIPETPKRAQRRRLVARATATAVSAAACALLATATPAAADQPACNNANHNNSTTNCSSPISWRAMYCAAANRKGAGYSSPSTPIWPTHAPTPVGSAGAQPNYFKINGVGVAVNAGCGGPTTATWALISNGWISWSVLY